MASLLTRIKAKSRLAALRVAITILPVPRPLLLLGADSSLKLCATIAGLGRRKVLIVTDEVLAGLGVVDPIVRRLQRLKVGVAVFTGVQPDPTFEVIDRGLTALQAGQCDAVLAVGGGSSIDAAKVIALAATNGFEPRRLVGILKARRPSLPLYVIPTTAGTGSEVTVGAVVSETASKQKRLVIDPKVVPVAAALDPRLLRGMPPAVTADTGMDALTHALEAWLSEFANPETDQYASAAVRLIVANLRLSYEDGGNLQAREAMALASHYAGLALNQAGLGYVHAIAHQLGACYGVSHGRANAIVLPHVLDFNAQVSQARLALLARTTGLASETDGDTAAAGRLIHWVRGLLEELQIETRVEGIHRRDFKRILKGAFAEAHGTYAVPRYMRHEDVTGLLEALDR